MKIDFQSPNILAIFSEKKDGSMRYSDEPGQELRNILSKIAGNRAKFLLRHGIMPDQTAIARLIHGKKVIRVSEPGQYPEVDGLITNTPGVFLTLTAGDCPPLYLFDPAKQAVGIIHCGWKGLAKHIPEIAARAMTKEFRTNPDDLLAWVGPGIGACHYEIKNDVFKQFKTFEKHAVTTREGKIYLALESCILSMLEDIGVLPENISGNSECTWCAIDENREQKYFSFRRDRSNPLETMMGVIGIIK